MASALPRTTTTLLPAVVTLLVVMATTRAIGDAGAASDGGQRWGLDDRTATVGKLFEYRILPAVTSPKYTVSEAGSDVLPGWLHFNAKSATLEGVPELDDLHKTFTIRLSVDGALVDDFDISVIDDEPRPLSGASPEGEEPNGDEEGSRPIRCLPGSATTTATIVLDADVSKLTGHDRVQMLQALSSHLQLPASVFRLVPGRKMLDDSSALVAGAGNIVVAQNSESQGTLVQWEVGCGNVFAVHMDVLERVEKTALDGTMSRAIGVDVIGWHVANKKPVRTRLRRLVPPRVSPTATATITVRPPTARPVPTKTVIEPGPTRVPSTTRPVPLPTTTSSPLPIQPTRVTTERPHRTKTGGRHHPTTRTTRPPKKPKTTTPEIQPSRVDETLPTRIPPATISSTTIARLTTSTSSEPDFGLEPSLTTEPTTSTKSIIATPPLEIPRTATATRTKLPATRAPLTTPVTVRFPAPATEFKCTNKPFHLNLDVNQIVNTRVPSKDLFAGGVPVKLTLLTSDRMIAKHWLSLNEVTHHLSGMPLEQHIGYQEYTLEGMDEDGRVARCNDVTVEVRARPLASRKEAVFEATAKFNISYDYFCDDADLRIDVANRLGRAFGDDDSSHLAITSITRGSVVMGWTNTSIVGGGDGSCPAEQIGEIQTKMFTNEGTLRKSFQDAMDPYEILGASLTPRGHCTLAVVTISPTTSVSSEDLRVGAKTASTSNSVTAIIIPVLIIILLVVIASIIACVLIRRRKRMAKKAASPDKSVKHGAPVIFAYELDDATSTTPSKPLIGGANSERPPAPPNYQLATAPTPPSTDHRRALLSTDPAADQMSPLKYQPPPGSMVRGGPGSSSAQSAARHPPTYQST